MNNNERLEVILKIRDIRNSLPNMNLLKEEKEIIKLSLNLYEEELDVEIAKINNTNNELKEEGIDINENIIDIPIEENTSKYLEYANIYNLDIINIINNLLIKLDNDSELFKNNKQVVLKSLKNYLLYIEQIDIIKKNSEKNKNFL